MMNQQNKMVIAVDGYSSTGKSTLAKDIAKHYKIRYIDSGAMYRAVTFFALNHGIINKENQQIDKKSLRKKLKSTYLDFKISQSTGDQFITLNGENIEEDIRTMDVSNYVSYISKIDFVRAKMVERQREFEKQGSLVMDGRDIGTVVFPKADVKFFVTANKEIRARRRYDELINNGFKISFEEVKRNIQERDRIDQSREISPLKKAEDAIELDNSFLNREEQLGKAIEIIENKIG